jgi:hypothetical protein
VVRWLRECDVLLPGVTTLARLVASVRDEAAQRLWRALESLLTAGQRHVLDQLVEVPPGAHVSDLERWRKGPPRRASGPAMIKALDQVAEIMVPQIAGLHLEQLVPPRRLAELVVVQRAAGPPQFFQDARGDGQAGHGQMISPAAPCEKAR